MLSYILLGIVLFYGIPLVTISFANIEEIYAMLILSVFVINMLFSFISGMRYGTKYGFDIYYPLAVGVLFIPAVFIFNKYYSYDALYFAVFYSISAFLGCIIGPFIKKRAAKKAKM